MRIENLIFECLYLGVNVVRYNPLVSDIPQLLDMSGDLFYPLLSFWRHSPIMSSIISFEFDPHCVVDIPAYDKDLFFPQSHHLTHLSITFRRFDECVRLLNEIGAQLHSFDLNISDIYLTAELDSSDISLVSNLF
jgi:hypothetical protein